MKSAPHLLLESSKWISLGRITSESRHEINNLLSVISALNQKVTLMMRQDRITPEALQEVTQKIDSKVNEIAGLLKDTREYSRSESDFSDSQFTFGRVIDLERKLYGRFLEKSGIELRLETVELEEVIKGPFSGTVEIVSNLIHYCASVLKTHSELEDNYIKLSCRNRCISITLPECTYQIDEACFDYEKMDPSLPNGAGLGPILALSIAETTGLQLQLRAFEGELSFDISK